MMRILHLEDRRDDAFFVKQALTDNRIATDVTVVATRPEFESALEKSSYDLILADSGLPGFSALEALEIARVKNKNIGFICVSGAGNEERVRASLNAGAIDYVLKDQLWELVASVRREEERLKLLWKNRAMTRLITAVQDLSLARDLNSIMAIVRRAARELTGADGATFVLRDGDCCYYADEDAIEPLWKGQRFPLSICISGWAMLNREPAVIEDIYADSRIPAAAYRPTFVKSLAMVPIRTAAPIGAIGNYWATRRQPRPEEVELLQALANTTSVAMENVQVYQELERRVKDRTAQLEVVNRELESFSYAVSHDLRAPLRSIGGFAAMAVKQCENVLPEKGKDYLNRVQANVVQMQNLIEDLMRLSRIARSQLRREKVDLSKLAKEITAQLTSAAPERKAEVTIAPDMVAEADAGLLRVVLENLLSNAWKYSAKRECAQIHFDVCPQSDGRSAFRVRDNGAGFDMQYVNKLFQPFQRLHTAEEFPGTGVGLTTVQRIIHRHGGRLWVEAAVDQGATFYFTLDETASH